MTNLVPILVYHAISDSPPGWIAPYTVSPAAFAAHLDLVVNSGRVPINVSGYVDRQCDGTLPERPVLITVDDGFADFANTALPILAERDLPSTLYVTTGALADRRQESVLPAAAMLRSSDLPVLEAAGVEIGAHSHTHRQLELLATGALADDLFRSRDVLADTLGHHIRSFAYPHGYWRARVRLLVAEAGFDSACGLAQAYSSTGDHPLALPPDGPRRYQRVYGGCLAERIRCSGRLTAISDTGVRLASISPRPPAMFSGFPPVKRP